MKVNKFNRGCASMENNSITSNSIGKKCNNDFKGKIIAFIGVDGSGKSTLSNDVYTWFLNRDYKVSKVYLGSGDGQVNAFTRSINSIRKIFWRMKSKDNKSSKAMKEVNNEDTIRFLKNPQKYCATYLRALSCYAVVKDNNKKIIKMHRDRSNSVISIIDRFPQIQQKNVNDGPKLEYYSRCLNSRVLENLAEKELALLRVAEEIQPDLVFRLNISAEVSMKRKPEQKNIKHFQYKIKTLKDIKFSKARVIDINAEKDYNSVFSEIIEIIKSEINYM